MNAFEVERIEIFTRWLGFYGGNQVAKLAIELKNSHFVREQFPERKVDELSPKLIEELLGALEGPCVSQFDPTLFSLPEDVISDHYESCWTNDHPAHLMRLLFSDGRTVIVYTSSQHEFMLPLKRRDSSEQSEQETFDPNLSQAIAQLMPDDYRERERLFGRPEMLNRFCKEPDDATDNSSESPEFEEVENVVAGTSTDVDESRLLDKVFRMCRGVLSPRGKSDVENDAEKSEQLLRTLMQSNPGNLLYQIDVKKLLSHGVDPNAADDVGQTALMRAAFPPFDRDMFLMLVKAGADLEAHRHNDGSTGLLLACSGGQVEAATEWVRAGANIECRTHEGETPLMHAANWRDIVKLLLEAGADVNAIDSVGRSALLHAVLDKIVIDYEPKLEAMQALIDAGADVNCRDSEGMSVLGYARNMRNEAQLQEEVVKAFKRNTTVPIGMVEGTRPKAEAIVNMLESAGARE